VAAAHRGPVQSGVQQLDQPGEQWQDEENSQRLAEHLASIPHRVKRYESPLLVDGKTVWRQFEEFDTSHSPDGLPEDYFIAVVTDFLATGKGQRGTIGAASSVLGTFAFAPFSASGYPA